MEDNRLTQHHKSCCEGEKQEGRKHFPAAAAVAVFCRQAAHHTHAHPRPAIPRHPGLIPPPPLSALRSLLDELLNGDSLAGSCHWRPLCFYGVITGSAAWTPSPAPTVTEEEKFQVRVFRFPEGNAEAGLDRSSPRAGPPGWDQLVFIGVHFGEWTLLQEFSWIQSLLLTLS